MKMIDCINYLENSKNSLLLLISMASMDIDLLLCLAMHSDMYKQEKNSLIHKKLMS